VKIVSCAIFEPVCDATGAQELEIFKQAFKPIERLFEYKDLVERLSPPGIELGPEGAKHIATYLSYSVGIFSNHYLRKAEYVLKLLDEALMRDIHYDYSPASDDFVMTLIAARNQQRANIAEALRLLRIAIQRTNHSTWLNEAFPLPTTRLGM
jgi:hypothetical protein